MEGKTLIANRLMIIEISSYQTAGQVNFRACKPIVEEHQIAMPHPSFPDAVPYKLISTLSAERQFVEPHGIALKHAQPNVMTVSAQRVDYMFLDVGVERCWMRKICFK